ncbi:MAG: phosphodiesterase [Clostridia bacterium]|jgi:putative phosphoesterase|nr:phosphodiesterase [Clostridia bacterium]
MKVLVISDIHGSGYYAEKIKEIDEREKTEKIILLGDLYYHGPRNDLSQEYNPMKVAEVLNSLKNKLLVIKGNCDAEVDEMISEFDFQDHILMKINGKNIYFTHGHKYNIDKIPYEEFDMLIYGHIHQGFIEEKEGYIFANPGSISLPKCNTEHSYIILDENKIILKRVDGEILKEYNY